MPQQQRQVVFQDEIIEGNDYFIIESGNSCNSKKQILECLLQQRPGLKEVHSVDVSDVILVFCYIVSRAGTDIDAALNKLNSCSASKPAVFIVLHHTFDSDKVVPDSSRYVNRINTLTVDCLFNEDEGLLKCNRNDEALDKIVQRFKCQSGFGYAAQVIHMLYSSVIRPHEKRTDASKTDQSDAVLAYFQKWNLPCYIFVLIKGVLYIFVKVKSYAAQGIHMLYNYFRRPNGKRTDA